MHGVKIFFYFAEKYTPMKNKIYLSFILGILLLASCKKDRSCRCDIVVDEEGTIYSINAWDEQEKTPYKITTDYSTDSEWEKITKTKVRDKCPIRLEEIDLFDNTQDVNGNLVGRKGSITKSTKCAVQ